MEANLQAIVDNVSDESRPAVNLLKATIEYKAESDLAAQKLADDVVFLCRAEDINLKPVQKGSSGYLTSVWHILIMFSRCIPTDHPWQDKMVKAIENLRLRDGVAPSMVSTRMITLKRLRRTNDNKSEPSGMARSTWSFIMHERDMGR